MISYKDLQILQVLGRLNILDLFCMLSDLLPLDLLAPLGLLELAEDLLAPLGLLGLLDLLAPLGLLGLP